MAANKRALVSRLDPAGLATIADFLRGKGFEVDTADNGRDALEKARDHLPDLVVADGVLPKMSGFELCREVKTLADAHTVPVVLILEQGDNYGRGRARVEGADMVVGDPMLHDDLDEILRLAEGGDDRGEALLGQGGARDRFVKALLRDTTSRNDGFLAKISDPLTGLHHRTYTTFKLEEEFKKSRRYGNPLAILLVDIDNYAELDKTPHKSAAQEMLLEVSGIFLCESRDVDVVGRVDDARFLLILPNTDLNGARIMADRVFQQVCQRRVHAGETEIPVRASVGIAALPSDDVASVDDFVERAVRGVRTAKSLGGNRICAWSDTVKT